jgi:uncharacterized integral membrane protein
MEQTPPPVEPPEPTQSARPTMAAAGQAGAPATPGAPVHGAAAARVSTVARLVIGAVVVAGVVLAIFCAQNTQGASVKFLAFGWPGAPLFVVVLASVGLGIVIGSLFVWLRLARYSAQHRILGRRQNRP